MRCLCDFFTREKNMQHLLNKIHIAYNIPCPQGMSFETIRFQLYDIPYFPYFLCRFFKNKAAVCPHTFYYPHSFARSTKEKMLNKDPREHIHEPQDNSDWNKI